MIASVPTWGMLAPLDVSSTRRVQTLGLGAAVRTFNDRAVPGMGGVWFVKQLTLPIIGLAVAERVGATGRNIQIANAIEALACYLALRERDWNGDPRLRGSTKMQSKTDLRFDNVRRPSFYVTQPMRTVAVQPLRALGLVDGGTQFNSFRLTDASRRWLDAIIADFRPHHRSVVDHLTRWVRGEGDDSHMDPVRECLSPVESASEATRAQLRDFYQAGDTPDAHRRRQAIRWVEPLDTDDIELTWDRPATIDDDHWNDIRAGAAFFLARDAALDVLANVESFLGLSAGTELDISQVRSEEIGRSLQTLERKANEFLALRCDPSPDREATAFCNECRSAGQGDPTAVIRNLVNRDKHVLKLWGDKLSGGPAFLGTAQNSSPRINDDDPEQEIDVPGTIYWPDGISGRLRNLHSLHRDLNNDLDFDANQ